LGYGRGNMKVLDKEKDLSKFFELVKKTPNRALLLDYDGTLAPFRIKRNEARPYPGVAEVLERIIETRKTRLVLISGRGLDDLIPLLGMTKLPEIWGSHGGERLLPNGKYDIKTVSDSLDRDLKKAADWLKEKGWSEHLEKKPLSLALHWRGMKEEEIAKISMTVKAHLPRLVNEKIPLQL
jgi:trehalose 6-phosphate phosphatase